MVQLSHALATGACPATAGSQSAQLSQLLSRLQHSVLHPSPEQERRLRASEFERTRLSSNLDYARDLLTKLEQDALAIKGPGKRQHVQTDLVNMREILEQLVDRMEDLTHTSIPEEDASSEGEDILADIIPTPSESADSMSQPGEGPVDPGMAAYSPPAEVASFSVDPRPHVDPVRDAQQPPPPQQQQQLTHTSQTLRSRPTVPSSSAPQSHPGRAPTPSAHTTARAALFSSRRPRPATSNSLASTATAEAILDHHRAEQDALSESILRMAGRLKEASKGFSRTLDLDREVLAQAGDAVDTTSKGLDRAGKRMNSLVKLTEGKGWWGRMLLFAWVYGLMVALLVVVFVLPKLRF